MNHAFYRRIETRIAKERYKNRRIDLLKQLLELKKKLYETIQAEDQKYQEWNTNLEKSLIILETAEQKRIKEEADAAAEAEARAMDEVVVKDDPDTLADENVLDDLPLF